MSHLQPEVLPLEEREIDSDEESGSIASDEGEFDEAEAAMEAWAQQLELGDSHTAVPLDMQLTTEERDFALRIREAIERDPAIDNLTDMTCACFAIAMEGDLEKAIDQVCQMQGFIKEYSILDTLEHGLRHLTDILLRDHATGERYLLSIEKTTMPYATGGYTLAVDLPKLDLRNYRTPLQIQNFFTGHFYMSLCVSTDFMAVRAGLTVLAECDGHKLKNHMVDLNFFKRMLRDTAAIFPVKHNQMRFFNTSVLVNTMASMAKSVLPKTVSESFRTGCKCPLGERLDVFYNMPTTEIAEARLRIKLEECLRKRYHNEKHFKLETA